MAIICLSGGLAAIIWTSVPTEEVLKATILWKLHRPIIFHIPLRMRHIFGLWSESILAGFGLKGSECFPPAFCIRTGGSAATQRK